MQAYDVVIIDAGHNSLVCVDSLRKKGYGVLLLEKSLIPRGETTTTKETAGFEFNFGAIAREFIHPAFKTFN